MSNILMKLNYFIIAAPTVCNATTCSSDLKRGIAKPMRVFVSRAWLNHFCSKTIKGEIRGDVAIVELEEDIAFGPTVQPACLNRKDFVFSVNQKSFSKCWLSKAAHSLCLWNGGVSIFAFF